MIQVNKFIPLLFVIIFWGEQKKIKKEKKKVKKKKGKKKRTKKEKRKEEKREKNILSLYPHYFIFFSKEIHTNSHYFISVPDNT